MYFCIFPLDAFRMVLIYSQNQRQISRKPHYVLTRHRVQSHDIRSRRQLRVLGARFNQRYWRDGLNLRAERPPVALDWSHTARHSDRVRETRCDSLPPRHVPRLILCLHLFPVSAVVRPGVLRRQWHRPGRGSGLALRPDPGTVGGAHETASPAPRKRHFTAAIAAHRQPCTDPSFHVENPRTWSLCFTRVCHFNIVEDGRWDEMSARQCETRALRLLTSHDQKSLKLLLICAEIKQKDGGRVRCQKDSTISMLLLKRKSSILPKNSNKTRVIWDFRLCNVSFSF